MSRATEIYDRIIKMEMQKTLDAEQYKTRLAQQQIISDAGVTRNRDQQKGQTRRQAGLNETNLKKAYIDERYKTNKDRLDYNYKNRKLTSDEEKDVRDFNYTSAKDFRDFNNLSAKERQDVQDTQRQYDFDVRMDQESKKQKKDEDLIAEGQALQDKYAELVKVNRKVYPLSRGKGKDKEYYLVNDKGNEEIMSEAKYYSHLANNDKIDVLMNSLANGYNNILTKRGLVKKASDMTPAQIKSLKDRKARSPKWKIDSTKGLITKEEGLSMGQLASKWANRLTNDKLPIGSFPDGLGDLPTMSRFGDQRQFGSANKTINPDLITPSNKGGINAGANQGVNTGKGFRDKVTGGRVTIPPKDSAISRWFNRPGVPTGRGATYPPRPKK